MSVSVLNTTSGLSGKTLVVAESPATITGLFSYNRGSNAPFAVNSGAGLVTYLNADFLDGFEGAAFLQLVGGTMVGDLKFTDALYDIGKSGATRPRDGFFSRDVVVGRNLTPGTVVADLLFTDATYDIGKSGATRPRDGFFSRNVVVSGTLGVTGVATLTAKPVISAGLQFPATQAADADANTFDDYEEGSWTPADGSGAALALTTVEGQYVKLGQLVVASCTLTYPATGSGASAVISGLPFTAQNSTNNMYGATINFGNASVTFTGLVVKNTATIAFFDNAGTAKTNANLTTATIRMTVIYRATA